MEWVMMACRSENKPFTGSRGSAGLCPSISAPAVGYSVVRDLSGHGIGRTIHERPTIPNQFDRRCSDLLTEGLIFTIEPLIAIGTSRTITLSDGWTVRTRDRSRSAHHEHTVLVTGNGARLLTAWSRLIGRFHGAQAVVVVSERIIR
jgi:methionine aminopeptidase